MESVTPDPQKNEFNAQRATGDLMPSGNVHDPKFDGINLTEAMTFGLTDHPVATIESVKSVLVYFSDQGRATTYRKLAEECDIGTKEVWRDDTHSTSRAGKYRIAYTLSSRG